MLEIYITLSVTANGIRYHPMIIRFCVSHHPGRRTLRDYRNEIGPKVVFNEEGIHELKDLAENLFDV